MYCDEYERNYSLKPFLVSSSLSSKFVHAKEVIKKPLPLLTSQSSPISHISKPGEATLGTKTSNSFLISFQN